jgi:hypothetical protein
MDQNLRVQQRVQRQEQLLEQVMPQEQMALQCQF